MDLIVLNIGNTNTQWARFASGRLGEIYRMPSSELGPLSFPHHVPMAASSVIPSAGTILAGFDIFWLDATKKHGIDLSLLKNPSGFGSDRLANLVAAADFSELPAIVADFGTAITIDLLGEGKRFEGGVIIPGRIMMRQALNSFTAQIPIFENFDANGAVLGLDTREAVSFGCDKALIGGVREIISSIKLQCSARSGIPVLAAGGDADFFLENVSGLTCVGNAFTLRGTAKAWELHNES